MHAIATHTGQASYGFLEPSIDSFNPKPKARPPLAAFVAMAWATQEIDRRSRAPRLFFCPFGSSLRMHAIPNRSAWPHLIDSAVSLSAWLLDRRRAAALSEGVADETAPTPP